MRAGYNQREREHDMKMSSTPVLIAAAMVLAVPGLAGADDIVAGCTLKTLRGSYTFTASGFNIVGGLAVPKAIVEVLDFHGDGTVSVPSATVSINGVIIRSLDGLGSYTLEDDCSGTLILNAPTFDIVVSQNGGTIAMIQTNPNTVMQGNAVRWAPRRN
jgi:hypothetical protein